MTMEEAVYKAVHEELMQLRVKLHSVLNRRSDIDSIVYHAQNRACAAAVEAIRSAQPLAGEGATPPVTVFVAVTGCYEERGVSGVYHTVQAAMAAHEGTFTHFSDLERWENNLDDNAYCTIAPYVVEGERAPVGTCETCQHFKRFEGRAGKTGDGECWNMDNPYCDFAHASFGCIFHTPRPETPHGTRV